MLDKTLSRVYDQVRYRLRRGEDAERLLDAVLTWALANRNTPQEFVRSYTYGPHVLPQVLYDAKVFLRDHQCADGVRVVPTEISL